MMNAEIGHCYIMGWNIGMESPVESEKYIYDGC